MTDLVCPACDWTIQDDTHDRRCTLCGTSMEPDPRADNMPEIRATLGEHIDATIHRALNTANTAGPVVLIHNADRIMIWPKDTIAAVHARRDKAYTERRATAVPDWADEWAPGVTCCGAPAVHVQAINGTWATACAVSGRSIDLCGGKT